MERAPSARTDRALNFHDVSVKDVKFQDYNNMQNTRSRHPAQANSHINFNAIADAAIPYAPAILARLNLHGRRECREFVALNPTRADRHLGSFRINLDTGRWADFATGDAGGDLVGLTAYVFGIGQVDAARTVAEWVGVRG